MQFFGNSGPITDSMRDYVRKNFKKAKHERRIALFILNIALSITFLAIAWGLASSSPLASLIVASIGLGMGILFHGLSAGSEGAYGDDQIRQQLIMQARIKAATGAMDDELASINDDTVDEEPGTSAKRKRDQAVRLGEDGELVPDELIDESERRIQRKA